MRCPQCENDDDKVLETRVVGEGAAIRRRRQCAVCEARFTTYEYVEAAAIEVVKRDGRREPFQREKLVHGIVRACEKRPVSRAAIEDLVDRMERELFRGGRPEVESVELGRRIMDALRVLDPVAYVRFASVYLNFQDINQFIDTVRELPSAAAAGARSATRRAAGAASSPTAQSSSPAEESAS
jgi:transcriptional repressor NrdR